MPLRHPGLAHLLIISRSQHRVAQTPALPSNGRDGIAGVLGGQTRHYPGIGGAVGQTLRDRHRRGSTTEDEDHDSQFACRWGAKEAE